MTIQLKLGAFKDRPGLCAEVGDAILGAIWDQNHPIKEVSAFEIIGAGPLSSDERGLAQECIKFCLDTTENPVCRSIDLILWGTGPVSPEKDHKIRSAIGAWL